MDEIRELLGRLGQLSEEEFANLRELVKAKAAEISDEDTSDEATALLSELGDATDQIVAEKQARDQKAQESREAREAAREKIRAIADETDDDEEDDGEPEEPAAEGEEQPEAEAEEPAAEEAPEPVAAAGAIQRMARRVPKPTPSPEAGEERTNGQLIVASGYRAGKPIGDRAELGQLIGEAAWAQVSGNLLNQKVIVASAKLDYPTERVLGGDSEENSRRIEAVCGPQAQAFNRRTGEPLGNALVATGGICQPVNVAYDVPTWATAETPLVDGLPSFEATRGGVRFVQPPDIAEWEGATGVWTEATDAEPGGATKPVKVLACGTEESVFVEAISTRIGFGNMQARFAPEQVAANTDLAFAAAARVRENNLLKLIEEAAVKDITTKKIYGATRDLLGILDANIDRYRNLHRLPDTQAITVILPVWVKGLIRADLTHEAAHQQSDQWNSLAVTDEMIESLFSVRRVNVIWHLDGQKEPGSKAFPNQFFATYTAEAEAKPEWPEKLVWYLFVEGAIQRLDAGRLDLGVVRDSTLDATNDFETFVEVFEGIAKRGFANSVLQFVSELCPSGSAALGAGPTCP